MLRKRKGGQSSLEFALIVVIVMGVLLSMGTYLKRGIQGKWKDSVDSLAEQYDPLEVNATIRHTLRQSTYSVLDVQEFAGNIATARKDETNMLETTVGTRSLDSYF